MIFFLQIEIKLYVNKPGRKWLEHAAERLAINSNYFNATTATVAADGVDDLT